MNKRMERIDFYDKKLKMCFDEEIESKDFSSMVPI